MEARVYKKALKRLVLFPDILSNLTEFLTHAMKVVIVKEEEDYVVICIKDSFLKKELFNGATWYKSLDKKFALFKEDEHWKDVFQRK